MTGPGKVLVRVNGQRLDPWDPFLRSHPATQSLGSADVGPGRWPGNHRDPLCVAAPVEADRRQQEKPSGSAGGPSSRDSTFIAATACSYKVSWLGLGLARTNTRNLHASRWTFRPALTTTGRWTSRKSSARAPGPLQQI